MTVSQLSGELKNAPKDTSLVSGSASEGLKRDFSKDIKICSECGVVLTDENWQLSNKKNYVNLCRKCNSKRRVEWQHQNRERDRQSQRNKRRKLRDLVIKQYGGICACCGEERIRFLTIDHKEGKGNEHKRSLGIKSSHQFHRWLKNNNYPSELQVLCFNCNLGKGKYKICPHNIDDFNDINSKIIEQNKVKKSIQKLRFDIIRGYRSKCECCGESNPYFLTIHHRYNDGHIERKHEGWQTLYRRLRRENFPRDRYQLLCFNCNCSKSR